VSVPRVHVVLVRPQNPANIGAVARVMRNTGLQSLRLVQPGDWRRTECWRSAWGAHDVLEQARESVDLQAALAGAAWGAAFSGQVESHHRTLDVRELATRAARLDAGQEACLVFGPESSGLTRGEIAVCGLRVRIPSHPAQPSLNLSHAVMVAGYEILRACESGGVSSGPPCATHDDKERLLTLWRQALEDLRALPPQRAEAAFGEWRALLLRLDLTTRELRLLEHAAHRLLTRRPPEAG